MDAVEEYRQHQIARRLSRHTIHNAAAALARLEAWLGAPAETATPRQLADYSASLAATLAPSSHALTITELRAFYRWALRFAVVTVDPTSLLDRPKVPPGLPRPIPSARLRLLLEQASGRVGAGVVLAAFAGMRAGEVAAARDVWLDGTNVVISGKGGRSRVVPAHPRVAAVMAAAAPFAWPRHDGGQASGELVSAVMNRWMHVVGVPDTLHSLRHWFATELYRGSHDLRMVQAMLGHASPATTAVYAAFDARQAAAAVVALAA